MSGLLGVYSFDNVQAFPMLYYGLYAIQHRGQAAVGVGTIDEKGQVLLHKDEGLISDTFGRGKISSMPGNKGLGHCQYKFMDNAKPKMPVQYDDSLIAIDGRIHNKDFSFEECAEKLSGDYEEAKEYLESIDGKFALLFMNEDRFIIFKGQDGVKPLAIGQYEGIMMAASETAAIESIGGRVIREIQAGEIYFVTKDRSFSFYLTNKMDQRAHLDAFEFMYTARPDSVIDGISIYQARYRLGQTLWQEDQLSDGIVVGTADSGLIPALGYANASHLPYQEGFVRNRYVGRTFIQQSQRERELSLQIKLTPIRQNVMNRTIILIDDSIVRGSTITRTVQSLKKAGAKAIHVRIAAPPVINDASVTVDIASKDQLIAYNHSLEEIREIIGCDSIKYLSLDGFHRSIGRNELYEPYFIEDEE